LADVTIEGGDLVVALSAFERAESFHGDIRVPLSSVRSVAVVDNLFSEVHGMRAPGTGIPGMTMVGTLIAKGEKTFAVIHHDGHRGVRIALEGEQFVQLLVGCDDPESVAAAITAAT
jgi:hypothetical protein